MKVLTKSVLFEGQEFVLIQNSHEGRTYYGTIPCTELDSTGRLKRQLNGAEMQISWENPAVALENRRREVVITRLLNGLKSQGIEGMEAFKALQQCEEYQNLYKR